VVGSVYQKFPSVLLSLALLVLSKSNKKDQTTCGTFTVCVFIPDGNFWYTDPTTGEFTGFLYDLWNSIQGLLPPKYRFVYKYTSSFPDSLNFTEAGVCDLLLASTTVTVGREFLLDFAPPMLNNSVLLVVDSDQTTWDSPAQVTGNVGTICPSTDCTAVQDLDNPNINIISYDGDQYFTDWNTNANGLIGISIDSSDIGLLLPTRPYKDFVISAAQQLAITCAKPRSTVGTISTPDQFTPLCKAVSQAMITLTNNGILLFLQQYWYGPQ